MARMPAVVVACLLCIEGVAGRPRAAEAAASTPARGLPHGGAGRSGAVPFDLRPPLRLSWEHVSAHPPRPAWREPRWEPQRIDHDYAHAVSVVADTVLYASSSDHALHALDLRTGRERWACVTEGPVRLAADAHGPNILFGSDDGFLYCVLRADGGLVWRHRPEGIPDRRLIGNEQMISRWPCRTGALVEGDRVFAGFGILAPEGVAVTCLDASTGEVRWVNDTCGYRFMNRPHRTAMGGVAPEGYLAVDERRLVVACGRSTPALFDKRTGELLYHEADGDFTGGALNMASHGFVFTPADTLRKEFGNSLRRGTDDPEMDVFELATLVALSAGTGREVFSLRGGSRGAISEDGRLTLIGRGELLHVALDRVRAEIPARATLVAHTLGHFVDGRRVAAWRAPVERVYTLLHAGETILAGGRGELLALDARTGERLWRAEVRGQVRSMCAVPGAWIVSTTEGRIYRYSPEGGAPAAPDEPIVSGRRVGEEEVGSRDPGAGGYVLALGDQDVDSLSRLARRADLVIHPVAPGAAGVLRRELRERGLQGTRAVVHEVEGPGLPYVDWFADRVDWRPTAVDGPGSVAAAEVVRVLRPHGGVVEVACAEDLHAGLERELRAAAGARDRVARTVGGLRLVRGGLEGAGEWTHQYGDPGRRVSSDERRARLPLEAAWFGGLGPGSILTRHYRPPAPLVIDGRCFVFGTDLLTAFSIYNGRILWERSLPELARWPAAYRATGTALDHECVWVLRDRSCLALDVGTGRTLRTLDPPSEVLEGLAPGAIWEYLAVVDDLLVGAVGEPDVRVQWYAKAYPVNHALFALDKRSGAVRWVFRPREGIDSNAIAIDDGVVCCIDGPPRYPFLVTGPPGGTGSRGNRSAGPRVLVGLDLETGTKRWETRDLAPTQNCLWMDDGVVVATQIPVSRDLQDPRAEKAGGGVTAFSAEDGRRLWRLERVRNLAPMIIEGVFYTPAAHDLRTGAPVPPRGSTQGQFRIGVGRMCSTHVGCPTLAMARASALGFSDLAGQTGVYHYPVVRPSCWIHTIPAGGLIVVPESSSSCQCAFNYKTSIAFLSGRRHHHYAVRGSQGREEGTVRLNFGAPGFSPDADGGLWAPFPAPVARGRSLGSQPYADRPLPIPVRVRVAGREGHGDQGIETWGRHPDWIGIRGSERPYLHACGIAGSVRLRIRLPEGGSGSRRGGHRVSLHFCELDPEAGERVFDVLLQGETVLDGFSIEREAGGPLRALVRDFEITAASTVELELRGRPSGPAPTISALRVDAE